MFQLTPGETFPIVRQLNDPADTGTYYVQAVIKRSTDDTILATVNLTDKGSQRFKGNWQVAGDSGIGTFITITTKVYTDSAYTTQSLIYAVEDRDYLIQERPNRSFGGGTGINYDSLRRIIKEEIQKNQPEFPKIPKFDYSLLLSEIKIIADHIKGIKIPSYPNLNGINFMLKSIIDHCQTIKGSIQNLPAPEKVDLSNIERTLSDVSNMAEMATSVDERHKRFADVMRNHLEEAVKHLQEAAEKINNPQFSISPQFEIRSSKPTEKNGSFRLPRKVFNE